MNGALLGEHGAGHVPQTAKFEGLGLWALGLSFTEKYTSNDNTMRHTLHFHARHAFRGAHLPAPRYGEHTRKAWTAGLFGSTPTKARGFWFRNFVYMLNLF